MIIFQSTVLEKYSGYTLAEVEPLIWALNHMVLERKTKYAHLDSVFKKYSHRSSLPIFIPVNGINQQIIFRIFHQVALIKSLKDQPHLYSNSVVHPRVYQSTSESKDFSIFE